MRLFAAILLVVTTLWHPARAAERFFTTTDGVRLHYTDNGPLQQGQGSGPGLALVFVPGWTMPGWIFTPQISYFSRFYRVIVLDPRGQGQSDVPAGGYNQDRRGQDIAELIEFLGRPRTVLVGWSLGVLDSLAFVHTHGDREIAGLVLVDNSVGENPPPPAPPRGPPPRKAPRLSHAAYMARFVRSMFHRPQPADYLERLTEASLRTPEFAASALLSYPVPRTYWKEAVYATAKPVLYVVRPGFAGQAGNLAAHHPAAETVVIPTLGHALFVDDPPLFDNILQSFLLRRIGH